MSNEKYWETSPDRLKLPNIYHVLAEVFGWEDAVTVGLSLWRSRMPNGKNHGSHRACIYIPKKFVASKPPAIVDVIGEPLTRKLIAHFAGENLELHGIGEATLWRRDAGLIEQSRKYRVAVLSARFGITERHVCRILQRHRLATTGTSGTKRRHLPSPISDVYAVPYRCNFASEQTREFEHDAEY